MSDLGIKLHRYPANIRRLIRARDWNSLAEHWRRRRGFNRSYVIQDQDRLVLRQAALADGVDLDAMTGFGTKRGKPCLSREQGPHFGGHILN
jgi:hypothetical protein